MPTDAEDLRIANMALTRLGIGRLTDFSDTSEVASILTDQYDEWVYELLEDHPWNFAIRRHIPLHFKLKQGEFTNVGDLFTPTIGHNFRVNEGPFRIEPETTSGVMPTGLEEDTDYYMRTITANVSFQLSLTTDPTVAVDFSDDGTGDFNLIRVPDKNWSYAHWLPNDCLRVISMGEYDEYNDWEVEGDYIYHNYGSTTYIRYIYQIPMNRIKQYLFKRALALKIAMDLAEAGVKTSSVLKEIRDDYLVALQRAKNKDAQEGSPRRVQPSGWADEMGRIS